jgi:hypothetical protein
MVEEDHGGMNTLPLWLQITGIVVAVVTGTVGAFLGVLNLIWRRRDRQSHMKIEYYLGDDPPREWRVDAGIRSTKSLSEPTLWFRLENVGEREEFLSDAYIDVPDGGVVHPFPRQGFPLPRPLNPHFPVVFGERLRVVSRALIKEGCTGTVRLDFVIRLGRGKLHKKTIEIPDVEAKAESRDPE